VVWLKLLGVPAGLAYITLEVARDPRVGQVRLEPYLIAAALAVNQVALLLFAARMRLALAAFGVLLTLGQALRVHLQSVFYFFVLPMTVGQEIARFAKVKAIVGSAAGNMPLALALLVDRVVGAVAALAIALTLAPFVDFAGLERWGGLTAWVPWIALVAILLGAALSRRRIRIEARRIAGALRAGGRGIGACLAVSIATHVSFAVAVHLAALGANVSIDFVQSLFAVSAAMLFVVIPVSFAGVSPVEAASVGVLVGMGLPLEQAAVFAFIAYAGKLVAAFEGGAWEIAEGGSHLARLLAKPAKPAPGADDPSTPP
jgi:uncharacterized membrane protein YbhN (UPF0104 family)